MLHAVISIEEPSLHKIKNTKESNLPCNFDKGDIKRQTEKDKEWRERGSGYFNPFFIFFLFLFFHFFLLGCRLELHCF